MGSLYTRDVLLVLAASMFYMSCPMLTTPLITGFSGSLGASGALMGTIGGLMNIVSLLCRPAVGNLADRYSKAKIGLVGTGMLLAASLGYVFSVNSFTVVVARIFHGIGFACCSVALSTWLSNLLPPDKIGYGMGLYGTTNALASALGPALGVQVYQRLGYRPAFLCAALFSVGAMAAILCTRDKGAPTYFPKPGEKRQRVQLVDRKIFPVALLVMLMSIPYSATQSFLVGYAEIRQLAVDVSLFFPAYAVILVCLRMSMKSLFDRLPFGVFVVGGAACSALAMGCLALMRGNGVLLAAALFMAGSYGIMCSVGQSKAIMLAGKGRRGLANSTYYVGLDLGLALGPILGGILYEGVDPAWFFPALGVAAPLALLVYGTSCRTL